MDRSDKEVSMRIAQDFADELKKDKKSLLYILELLKQLEHWQGVASEIGDQNTELRKKVSELESRLRLGRGKYADLQKENAKLKRDINDFIINEDGEN